MLRLHTFGGCFLTRDGARLDELAGQRKALALLALLAAAGARGASRGVLADHLWPERDEERARTSLKQLVHALRTRVQSPELVLGAAELRLNPTLVTSDVAEFRDAVRRGDREAAVALYAGPFLDGFLMRDAGEFDRWATGERASLARDHARALQALAEATDARGDAVAAVTWWRRLADADPLSARAATGLMSALHTAGDATAALQHAREYQALLREELGAPPDAAVAELAARLQQAPPAIAPSRVAATPPLPPADARPSIAVLPFVNTSGDPDDEHFSDGLTDELIVTLAQVPGLAVIGRTSVFALKGRGLDARAVGDALHVATLLEGSVRRAEGRLKVTTQLVAAGDGSVLWAESFDRARTDVFAVQEEIARAIVGALRVQLGAYGPPHVRPADLAAYESYLKARYVQHTHSDRPGLLLARRYLDEAVARDPGFARAHAALSDVHTIFAVYGYGRTHERFAAARQSARRALTLDPGLAEAHAALAHVLFVHDYDWDAAEREFRHALALDPGYGWTHLPYAIYLQDRGRFADAVATLEAARAVDPLAPFVSTVLGRVHVNARQPELAVRALTEALALNDRLDLAHQQLGHAYLQLGRHADALDALGRASALSGGRDAAQLAYAHAVVGDRPTAVRLLDALPAPTAERPAPAFNLAMAHAGLGDADAAFRWLEAGYAERGSFMDGVMVTPAFDTLHADPRWSALLRRMGLAT